MISNSYRLSEASYRLSEANNSNKHEQNEPILVENPKRFTIFPIKYQDVWDMY